MATLAAFPPPSAPVELVRSRLMASCHESHRPELADLVQSAWLELDCAGLWVHPAAFFSSVNPQWLEARLLAAACAAGLSFTSLLVSAGEWPGREAVL